MYERVWRQVNVALYTYNTKPRGGVVHTLALAEALKEQGCSVTVFALGLNGTKQFYRPVGTETTVFPFETREHEGFEDRILRYIDTYTDALEKERLEAFDIHHAQDCISANALTRLGKKGLVPFFLRTVHHLDDFVTPALVECQHQSVLQPRAIVTVSQSWKKKLESLYSRSSTVIHNGVDERFFTSDESSIDTETLAPLKGKIVYLTIGGIEPRKNTIETLRAFVEVKQRIPQAVLVIAGGTTLFDYRPYRTGFERLLESLPAEIRSDVRIIPSPDDRTVKHLYRLAHVYLQPSIKEGWGLSILEAMASGTPVVASNIEVFQEFMTHEHNALLSDPMDSRAIAANMLRLTHDPALADRLRKNAGMTARQYTWPQTAGGHINLYRRVLSNE
ncbi:MSMEG_0565 family glycosyltransferase [Paenibacillus naphthalenovorans]|nr:MSMEG_0565 family glycosyltransferase [Paenibacillus naphthalenovorans]